MKKNLNMVDLAASFNNNKLKFTTADKAKTKKNKSVICITCKPDFQYDNTDLVNQNDLSYVLNNEFITSFIARSA